MVLYALYTTVTHIQLQYSNDKIGLWLMVFYTTSTIFQLYHGSQFIGGGNQSTWRKPPTCRKSLTNFIT